MKIKSIPYFFVLIALSIFMACGQNETKSPAHTQAIYWNESIEDLATHLEGQIEVLEEEHQELLALVIKNPSTDVLEQLKNHETIIARYKGTLKEYQLIIETHKTYFEKHESTALGINEIRAQHQQVHKNLITVQEDVTQISAEIAAFLSMYRELAKELDT